MFSFRLFSVIAAGLLTLGGALHAQTQSFTLSPLPDYQVGGSSEARACVVGLSPSTDGSWNLAGVPGETKGWGFKITWQSNAGDVLIIRDSTLTGDISYGMGPSYQDFIGGKGGNVSGTMVSGGTWENSFNATGAGIGKVVIFGAPGSVISGTLNLHLSVYSNQGGELNFLGDFTTSVDISVAITAPIPSEQSITFAAIGDKLVTDAPFPILASSTSSLAVTIYSSTPSVCTVTDGVATIHGSGECTLFAEQPGNDFYLEAPTISQTFQVKKVPVSVSLDGALQRLYDGNDQLLTATTNPANLPILWLYNGISTPPRYPGLYTVTALVNSPTYEGRAEATLSINDPDPSPFFAYANWLLTHFSPEEIQAGLVTAGDADLAEDGTPNLLKYAFGLDPWTTMSPEARAALPRFAGTGGTNGLVFSLPVTPTGDLIIKVEASSDLATWTEIARRTRGGAWTGSASVFTGTPDETGLRAETLVTEPPTPVHPRRFYRLNIDFAP